MNKTTDKMNKTRTQTKKRFVILDSLNEFLNTILTNPRTVNYDYLDNLTNNIISKFEEIDKNAESNDGHGEKANV